MKNILKLKKQKKHIIWMFPKIGGYPQIIHFNRDFPYKPSILGSPYFWKHPYHIIYVELLEVLACKKIQKNIPQMVAEHCDKNHGRK